MKTALLSDAAGVAIVAEGDTIMYDRPFFVTGGTLPLHASSYVSRQADTDLYEALADGQYCYLLNTRQMGKSSLVVRAADRLRQDIGAAVAIFELSAIGQNVTPDQLYYGLCNLLGQQLGLEDELDAFWFDNEMLSPMQRFFEGIRRVALAAVPGPLIIVVDEIDVLRTVQQHFSTNEFFGGIRDCHNRRVTQPEFQRLTFCLVGVATPSDLITDTRVSPFNVGQRIIITDFTEEEATVLAAGLGPNGHQLLSRVLYWTGGHPYLTQRLCYQLAKQGDLRITDVDRECARLFLSKTARESDDNLTFVRDRLLRNGEQRIEDMLDLYARVRSGKLVYDDDANPLFATLRLSGVVKVTNQQGRLQVRNRIYERVFDEDFVRSNMPGAELRRQAAAARRGRMQVGAFATMVITALSLMLWFNIKAQHKAEEEAARATRAEKKQEQDLIDLQQLNGTLTEVRSKLQDLITQKDHAQDQLIAAQTQEQKANDRAKRVNLQAEKDIASARQRLQQAQAEQIRAERIARDKTEDAIVADRRAALAVESAQIKVQNAELKSKNAESDASAARKVAAAEQKNAAKAREDAAASLQDAQHAREEAAIAAEAEKKAVAAVNTAREDVERLTAEADKQRKKREKQSYIYLITAAQNELESGSPYSTRAVAQSNGQPETGNIGRAEELLKEARASFSPPGFEWQYLNSLCHTQEHLTSLPLADGIASLAFAPDGDDLIAANTRCTLLYSQTGRKYSFDTNRYRTVALSPQGQYLGAGDGKGMVTIWNTTSATPVITFRAGVSAVTALALSRGRDPRVIVGTAAGRVSVWRLDGESAGRITLPKSVQDPILALALDEAGERAVVATDKETAIYEVGTGNRIRELNDVQGSVRGAAFFPGGSQVALVTADNRLHVYSGTTGSLLVTQPIDSFVKNPQTIAFSTQGLRIAIGGSSDVVATMQLMTTDPVQQSSHIVAAEFTPDSQHLAIASATGLQVPQALDVEGYLIAHARLWGSSIAFSPDGNYTAVGSRDGAVDLFDKRHPGSVRSLVPAGGSPITRLAFSPDSTLVAAGRQSGMVTVWHLATSLSPRTFQPHSSRIVLLAFLPGSDRLATSAPGDLMHLWTTDGVSVPTSAPEGDHRTNGGIALSANGKLLAIAQGDTIGLYEMETGKRYATCSGHINMVACLAFSPDGTRLVSGSNDGTVRLWDVATGEQLLNLRGLRYWYDGGPVSVVSFSPDGQAIAVGTEGGKAIVLRATPEG